ncbi:MAG: SAM-dependent methyltransferase [Candidatus Aldehydirespiratoraceae bacterium]|jgi:SAM-dependent methyltransferase
MTATETPPTDPAPDWKEAGDAWSHAAADWAYGFEPYARDGIETVFRKLDLVPGQRLLDVACGAGLALGRAARLGITVAGIDAADSLLNIARRRAPDAELVHGDMFDLPWATDTFDAVVAFNGIWGGCEDAVAEIARVCRPGGRIGITFWGATERLDLLDYFVTLGRSGPGITEEIVTLASINTPGEAERMLTQAGFRDLERGDTSAILEFTDDDEAWQTLRSPGLALPALDHTGESELRQRVLSSVSPFRSDDGTYRLVNELVHVTASLPE